MCVNVILCSRNGEKYLRAQIESILKQTEPSVRLLLSDDASTDGTQEIEKEYAEQYPDRVRVRFRTTPSGSAARHFFLALQHYAGQRGKILDGVVRGFPEEPFYLGSGKTFTVLGGDFQLVQDRKQPLQVGVCFGFQGKSWKPGLYFNTKTAFQ